MAGTNLFGIMLKLAVVLVPLSILLHFLHINELVIFFISGLAIIPLAGLMGQATEELTKHMGPAMGGFLNATFGNMTELIIALFAIKAGLIELVKASITGSIIGNVLLVLGLSMLCGGFKHKRQKFNAQTAGLSSIMLTLACIGLLMPALVEHTVRPIIIEEISLMVASVLILVYLASLVFSFFTHEHLFHRESKEKPIWSKKLAMAVLLIATMVVAVESEILVSTVEHAAQIMGMTELFIGVIVIAIIGNAAEHGTAVIMAMKNKMDLSFSIAIGSSTQIALFVAPVLVFVSLLMGHPMTLLFYPLEMISIILTVAVVYMASLDGISNWFEGLQLLSVYAILAFVFYLIPAGV